MPAAAAGLTTKLSRCTVAVVQKSKNLIHMDQYMTRSDLIRQHAVVAGTNLTTRSSVIGSSGSSVSTTPSPNASPLQRGSMCVQLNTPSTSSSTSSSSSSVGI